jgi:hypothetical protein
MSRVIVVVLALERLRQENQEFEASLSQVPNKTSEKLSKKYILKCFNQIYFFMFPDTCMVLRSTAGRLILNFRWHCQRKLLRSHVKSVGM